MVLKRKYQCTKVGARLNKNARWEAQCSPLIWSIVLLRTFEGRAMFTDSAITLQRDAHPSYIHLHSMFNYPYSPLAGNCLQFNRCLYNKDRVSFLLNCFVTQRQTVNLMQWWAWPIQEVLHYSYCTGSRNRREAPGPYPGNAGLVSVSSWW